MHFDKNIERVQGYRGGKNAQFGYRESWEDSIEDKTFRKGTPRERGHVQRHREALTAWCICGD